MVFLPNPFVEYESLEEAERAVGFELNVPEGFCGSAAYVYRVMKDEMLEVICRDADGRELARIRKAEGTDDISGDFSVYEDVITDNSLKNMTIRGNGGSYTSALWTENGYAFAVTVEEPVTFDQMKELLLQIY